MAGREHIVEVPTWFKFLIIAKIVIAIVVLGLAAYGATFQDWFGGNGYAIFCAIAIFVTEGWYLASTLFVPALYNCWAYLVLSAFQAIWWLSCWANLAAWAAAYNISYYGFDLDNYVGCVFDSVTLEYDCPSVGERRTHRNAMAAVAGIGALEWILVLISLVIFSIGLHRHRRSGAPQTANGGRRATPGNPQGTPGGVEAQKPDQQSYQMYPPTHDATTVQPKA